MGAINIAFADGHVQLMSNDMLANDQTGRSTGNAVWYPQDNP
jgi:prepilin-type processing-associated H-X9-DG protein